MKDKITILLIVLLVLCWTLNPFVKKKALKGLEPNESLLLNHCLVTIILLVYYIYLFYKNKCNISSLKNLNRNQLIVSFIAAIITVISSIILINLLRRANVSYVMPHIQPLVLLLTVLIGYFIFKEKLNNYQILGGLFTIGGLCLLNKKS